MPKSEVLSIPSDAQTVATDKTIIEVSKSDLKRLLTPIIEFFENPDSVDEYCVCDACIKLRIIQATTPELKKLIE